MYKTCSNVASNMKGGVVCAEPRRDAFVAFGFSISSLQVASGFACSVASLSLCPDHYLPGVHNLHCKHLADHQFDWGESSTCSEAHARIQHIPPPSPMSQEKVYRCQRRIKFIRTFSNIEIKILYEPMIRYESKPISDYVFVCASADCEARHVYKANATHEGNTNK